MTILTTEQELRSYRKSLGHSQKVALVPTMGNLHRGHLSLVEAASAWADVVIVSIFVNPTQFGPNEDFQSYPRTLDQDCKLLENLKSPWVVFAPKDPKEIYPEGFQTSIHMGELATLWEGKARPGHFAGVCTVVYQLFQLTRPHRAYFGRKDYQQLCVIRQMSRDLRLDVEIIDVPTIRDQDGLALSSRNQYLSQDERARALQLPHALQEGRKLLLQTDEKLAMKDFLDFQQKQMQKDPNWEYLEYCDAHSLKPLRERKKEGILLGLYRAGKTRLLDNLSVNLEKN